MIGSKDKDTLDSLFKDAFEQAPNTASSSGWDSPSAKVWAQIQTEIEQTPPPSGAAASSTWAWVAASVGIVAILAFAWYFEQAKSVTTPTKVATTEEAASIPATTEQAVELSHATEALGSTENKGLETAQTEAKVVKAKLAKTSKVTAQTAKATPIVLPSVEKMDVEKMDVETPMIQEVVEMPSPRNTKEHEEQAIQINATSKEQKQAKTAEIKVKPRFLNNLDRIKAETEVNEKESMPKIGDILAPLPSRPIPPVEF